MIDLHVHTFHSDGSHTVEEVLKKAEERNLEYISITDHDTCKAYQDLSNPNNRQIFSGKIINGIEMKCCLKDGKRIELLGYGIDINKMENWITNFYNRETFAQKQLRYFNTLYGICINKGLNIRDSETIPWHGTGIACFTVHDELKRYPENKAKLPEDLWEDSNAFARKYCGNPEYDFYIDKSCDYPTFGQAVSAIKEADGLVFIAHPYIYNHIEDIGEFLNDSTARYNIDGIECFYSTFSKEQSEFLYNYCKSRNLLISGGSDFHGGFKRDIGIGIGKGNLNIQTEVIKDWIHNIKNII